MNYFHLIAGFGCLFGFFFHLWRGNDKIDNVVFASNISIDVRTISRIVWHSVSLLLAISGIVLLKGAFWGVEDELAIFIAAYLFGFAMLFFYFQTVHLKNPIKYPHPIFFMAVAIIIIFGSLSQ